ncbi:hypothetical protein ABVK25_002563 [Lepraria finkii]|uniref:Ribosomal protein L22 n=1 Tax=Lepraria finkii TaxID=1340010 RepID=A0ABR4BJ75_9LECA
MSLSIPRRRLLQSATSLIPQPQCQFLPFPIACALHRRQISFNPFKRRKRTTLDPSTIKPQKGSSTRPTEPPKTGDLAPTSIFDPSTPASKHSPSPFLNPFSKLFSKPSPKPSAKPALKAAHRRRLGRLPKRGPPPLPSPTEGRDIKVMAAALDPFPSTRRRWLRKMVIRDVRGRGRLSKTEKILRTERTHLSKSPLIKTSIKKLYPLARQIAGKPLTEAMVQMRFSKKKAAREVLRHLELARDQAVVVRGMGLGAVGDNAEGKGKGKKEKEEEELVVEDKQGKRRVVTDRSAMYVDEAWVGRGPYEEGMDYRARGRGYRLRLPYTSISVVLKEESTRIRLAEERELKRQRKRVWVPLPDRLVTAQRQYPLW